MLTSPSSLDLGGQDISSSLAPGIDPSPFLEPQEKLKAFGKGSYIIELEHNKQTHTL